MYIRKIPGLAECVQGTKQKILLLLLQSAIVVKLVDQFRHNFYLIFFLPMISWFKKYLLIFLPTKIILNLRIDVIFRI